MEVCSGRIQNPEGRKFSPLGTGNSICHGLADSCLFVQDLIRPFHLPAGRWELGIPPFQKYQGEHRGQSSHRVLTPSSRADPGPEKEGNGFAACAR